MRERIGETPGNGYNPVFEVRGSGPAIGNAELRMSDDILDTIKEQIESNPILLYMKGSPAAPQCGFSAQTVQCLVACGERFAYVDILAHPEIRATLPGYANWPTFPQLYVEGELIGGCDIITEMSASGELEPLIKAAARNAEARSAAAE